MYKKIIWLIKIFFLIFSIIFLTKIDYGKIEFLNKNQFYALIILMIFHFLRVLRMNLIFYFLGQKMDLKSVANIYYIGLYLGIVTPGRLGEFYRIKMINDHGISKISNFNFIFLEKIIDIFALLFFISIIITDVLGFSLFIILLISSCIIFISIFLFFQSYNLLISLLKKILVNFNKMDKYKFFFSNNPCKKLGYKNFFLLTVSSIAVWLFFIFALKIGFNSNFNINFLNSINFFLINSVVTALPISIMGFGLRELVLLELFNINNLELIAMISFQFIYFNLISIAPGLFLYIKKEFK